MIKYIFKTPISIFIISCLFVLVLILWFFTPFLITKWSGQSCVAQHGQFGDQFGALNSLFTAFAFILLGVNAFFQYRQLSIQKQELDETKLTLKEDRERQNTILKLQTEEHKINLLNIKFTLERDLLKYLNEKRPGDTDTIKKTERNLDQLEVQINEMYSKTFNENQPEH
jgi:hypothetical protein